MGRYIIPWCICGVKGSATNCQEPSDNCLSCGFRAVVHEHRVKQIREEGLTTMDNGLRRLIIRKEEE